MESNGQKVKMKVFWQNNCPYCLRAKEIAKVLEEEIEVQYFDVRTTEGLSEACLNNVMSTPSMVITDENGNIIESWRDIVPEIECIRKRISAR